MLVQYNTVELLEAGLACIELGCWGAECACATTAIFVKVTTEELNSIMGY